MNIDPNGGFAVTQWQGWHQLPKLPRPALGLSELEQRWADCISSVNPRYVEPYGQRGIFFSDYLDEVVGEMNGGAAIWQVRLRRFEADTTAWRKRLRAADIATQDSVQLGCTIAALRIWILLASPADLDGIEGRWNASNLLVCCAGQQDAGRGAKRVRLLRKAAGVVDPDRSPALPKTSASYVQMKRRKLMLESNAMRIESFLKMRRRPQRWDSIASGFARAAALSEQAQMLAPVSQDRSVIINRLWESLASMRAAESRMDLSAARDCLRNAKNLANEIEEPFKYGGRWSSCKEVAAERNIIDCLEELSKGDAANPDLVVEHLRRWFMNTANVNPAEGRRRVMNLRRSAAEMAKMIYEGQSIAVRLAAFRREVVVDPYVKAAFEGVLVALQSAERGRASAYSKVLSSLRLNLINVDGDRQSLPPAESTSQLAPKWVLGKFEDNDATAAASLLRYLRVLVEYLWCVYRDSAIECGVDVPEISGEQFRAMPPALVGTVVSGLGRALSWDDGQYPAIALGKLNSIAMMISRSASDGNATGARDILSAVLDFTLVDLFPLIVRGIGSPPVEFPVDILVVRQVEGATEEVVAGVATVPPSWPYFALKPRYKRRGRLTQVISQRHVKPIHLYSAHTWPRLRRVRVLVEGTSDVAAFSAYFDIRMTWWRGYDIRINDCGGDGLPRRFGIEQRRMLDDADRADSIVIISDADKRTDTTWDRAGIWRHPHSFAIEPDLEMHNVAAFVEAICLMSDVEVDVEDVIRYRDNYLVDKRDRVTRTKNFVEYLRQELDLAKGLIKGDEFSVLLGQRLASHGSSILDDVVQRIDLLANGFEYDPNPEFPT